MNKALGHIESGIEFPFHDKKANNWQEIAALGVIDDLMDRRDIKHGFNDIDEDIKIEIVRSLSKIIKKSFEIYSS